MNLWELLGIEKESQPRRKKPAAKRPAPAEPRKAPAPQAAQQRPAQPQAAQQRPTQPQAAQQRPVQPQAAQQKPAQQPKAATKVAPRPAKSKKAANKAPRQPKKKMSKRDIGFACFKGFVAILLTICCAGFGVVAGAAIGYITTSTAITEDDLVLGGTVTTLYDINGNVIAELKNTDNKNILEVSFDEVPQDLKDAFVAIEDKRFYDHQGVDIIRTGGAILQALKGDASFGGSSITQQLVKNITGDNSASIPRKIREIWRALQLESRLDKDEILTYYMNIIYMGYDCYGVGAASLAYFGKPVSELSLAECAFLAGITNNPSYYNPLTVKGRENALGRQGTILREMLTQGFITEEEHAAAKAEVLVFNDDYTSEISSKNIRSYFVEQVILEVRTDLMEMGYTRGEANNIIYGSGAKIYTTMDPNVQNALNTVYSDDSNFPYNAANPDLDKEYQVQSAMVIMDPQTGYISGLYGGSGKKTINFGLNRATQINRQPGSTLKPIMIYGPLLDNHTITLSTVMDDVPKYMNYNSPQTIYPNNYDYNVFKGSMTMVTALAESNNVIPATLFKDNMEYCLDYLKKLGIDRTTETYISTALGGLSVGVSPLDMAAAYVPYANEGFYYTPIIYTKLVDSNGKTMVENVSESTLICQDETTSSLVTLAMQEVVNSGTAAGKISIADNNGTPVPAAGKTGTTDNYKDSWFVGYTPEYVGATWYGFDDNQYLEGDDQGQATVIWGKVMAEIHKNLNPTAFSYSGKIVSKEVCKYSGMLATDLCTLDPRGSQVATYYYASEADAPTATCTNHVRVSICNESGMLAHNGCSAHTTSVLLVRPFSFTALYGSTIQPLDLQYVAPTRNCTVHTEIVIPPTTGVIDPNTGTVTDPNAGTTTPTDPNAGATTPPEPTTPGDPTTSPDGTAP